MSRVTTLHNLALAYVFRHVGYLLIYLFIANLNKTW